MKACIVCVHIESLYVDIIVTHVLSTSWMLPSLPDSGAAEERDTSVRTPKQEAGNETNWISKTVVSGV